MTSKILITITVNFASHRGTDEEHVMHSRSDNIKIMINDETDEVMMNHFLIHNPYQIGSETSMGGSNFIFMFIYYKCHKPTYY